MGSTTTVLDSLRWLNPEVEYDADGGSNTRNIKYHTPKKIIPWTEFNMDTVASIAGGKLLHIIQTTPGFLSIFHIPYGRFFIWITDLQPVWNVFHTYGNTENDVIIELE